MSKKVANKMVSSCEETTPDNNPSYSNIGRSLTDGGNDFEPMIILEGTIEEEQDLELEFVSYENQRWWLGQGWCDKMLPQERSAWSDLSGNMYLPKTMVHLPNDQWKWKDEWQVSQCPRLFQKDRPTVPVDHDGKYDNEGWQYSMDWSQKFSGNRSMTDIVRRRRWVRKCVFVGTPEPKGILNEMASEEANQTTAMPETSDDKESKVSLNALLKESNPSP